MQRQIMIGTILVALMCCVATAQHSSKQGAGNGVDAALQKRFEAYSEALKKSDIAALNQIWAEDYVFINPRGELVTKAQRLENLKTGNTEIKDIERHVERTQVHGNVALMIGRVKLEAKYANAESSGEYRFMNVWIKEGNEWRLGANQITLIKK